MKQIDALEDRLGVTLFRRTNHGLQLTDAGASVLGDAKYLVDYLKIRPKTHVKFCAI